MILTISEATLVYMLGIISSVVFFSYMEINDAVYRTARKLRS